MNLNVIFKKNTIFVRNFQHMQKNKPHESKARERWTILDRSLQSEVPVSTEDLCKAYHDNNVDGLGSMPFRHATKRYAPLVRKDLFHFRSILTKADTDVELVTKAVDPDDERKRGHCYSRQDFSILPFLNNFLSDADHQRIDDAFRSLETAASIPHDAIEYIRFEAKGRMDFRFKGKNSPVLFDTNRRLKGREWLPVLYDAIRERAILSIEYVPFGTESSKPLVWRCHPHVLKEYNNRWFLFCYNENKRKHYWNIAVDRIVAVRKEEGKSLPPRTDYADHFDNMIGVTYAEYIPGEKTKSVSTWVAKDIVLKIDEITTWGRILSKPIHDSQVIIDYYDEEKGGGTIRISVIPNAEMYMRILSLGEHVSLLSPKVIRDRMASIVHNLAAQYLGTITPEG